MTPFDEYWNYLVGYYLWLQQQSVVPLPPSGQNPIQLAAQKLAYRLFRYTSPKSLLDLRFGWINPYGPLGSRTGR